MFAETPEPPYTAVVFTSRRSGRDDAAYAVAAASMVELARGQPGFLGVESVHDQGSGVGITVSYWSSDRDARAWKGVVEHREAQRLGRDVWYADYRVRVATVTRAYGPHAAPTG